MADRIRLTRSERNCAWVEAHCRIPEGRLVGRPVKWTKHQRRWMKKLYDSPTRTFILSVGRKNAKTVFSGFIVMLHLCGPEERPDSQLYSAAQSRDQAAVLLLMADLYLNRERQVDRVLSENPVYALLLNPYRSMSVAV